MDHKIIVAGIGPGSRDFILPRALKAIDQSHYLVGGHRALSDFAHEGQETYPVTGKLSLLAKWLEKRLPVTMWLSWSAGIPAFTAFFPG